MLIAMGVVYYEDRNEVLFSFDKLYAFDALIAVNKGFSHCHRGITRQATQKLAPKADLFTFAFELSFLVAVGAAAVQLEVRW